MAALGVDFRLMIAHPENFRGGEARQRGIGGDLDQPLRAHALGDLVALRLCALIAPNDGGAQHLALLVQHDQTVHLARNAQRNDLRRVHGAFAQHRADGGDRRVPPIGRILLRPAVLRLIHRILHRGGGHDRAALIEQDGFGARGSKVNA